MKVWIVLQGNPDTGTVYCPQGCENINTFDRIEDARSHKHKLRTKWPYLNAWVVELDMEPQPKPTHNPSCEV